MSLYKIFSILFLFFSALVYLIIGLIGDYRSEIELYFLLIFLLFVLYGFLVFILLNSRFPGKGYLDAGCSADLIQPPCRYYHSKVR